MPNTLDLIAEQGRHLQPLLRLLPALLPLAGQPADRPLRPQQRRPRQRPAQRRLLRLRHPRRLHPQPRHLAAGRRLPHDPRRQVPQRLRRRTVSTTAPKCRPAGAPGTPSSTPTPTTTTTATRSTTTARSTARSATPAAGKRANTAQRDDFGCPLAPLNGLPCYYETDVFNRIADRRAARHAARTALLPAARLHRPARRLPPPRRPRAGAAPLRLLHGRAAARTAARRASTRATSTTSRASSAKRRTSRRTEIHTYRVYYQKALESLRSVDDGVKQIVDTLGALHRLRNTYIIFTSDNGFFYGEHRLIGGKFLAYEPSTHLPFLIRGPGIKPGTRNRRAGGQHRHRADDPRTGRRQTPTRASTAARWYPFAARPRACAPGGRSSSSPSSRPTTSKRTAARPPDRRPEPAAAQATAPRAGRRRRTPGRTAPAPRSWRRRRTTRGSASAPTSTSSGPTARKSSTTSTRTPTSSTTWSAIPNFFPIRDFLHTRTDERLETCVGRAASEAAPKIPLTRKRTAARSARTRKGTSANRNAREKNGNSSTRK